MIQYEIVITGRVQGVGYRYFTLKKAHELNIKGWVKNAPNEQVEIVAQGDETDLNTFMDYLQMGPPLARVDKISKYKMHHLTDFDNFSVKY
jgi:acylphosphatase